MQGVLGSLGQTLRGGRGHHKDSALQATHDRKRLTGPFRSLQDFSAETRNTTHAIPIATPPCHILATNQDSLTQTGPSTSDHVNKLDMGWRNASRNHLSCDLPHWGNRDYTGMWVLLGSTDLMAGKVMFLRSNQGGRLDSNESVADSFRSDLVGFKSWSATILGAFYSFFVCQKKPPQSGSAPATRGNRDYTGMWVRLGSTDLMAGKVMFLRSNQGGRLDSNESVADSFRSDLVGFKSWSATILGAFYSFFVCQKKPPQSGSAPATRGQSHPSLSPSFEAK
ncbi:hypothetical protein TNCV_4212861 [Trichonephila clavipes]|nr:hypothetical protein TNCV_4212861 [Trichonephila clavipes]